MKHNIDDCQLNHGVLLGNLPTDYMVGVNSPIKYEVINPTGDWDSWLPPGEWQKNNFFDTYACVTFSALNILETLVKFHTGKEINFSDRFTAKMSGTVPGSGNYLYKVADSIRNDGVLLEEDWPAPPNYTQETYYAEIPQELKDKAKNTLTNLGFEKPLYEFLPNITTEEVQKHLKQSPIQAVIPGHAIAEYQQRINNWSYFDSYDPFRKTKDGLPQVAMKLILTPSKMTEAQVRRQYILMRHVTPSQSEVSFWVGKTLDEFQIAMMKDDAKLLTANAQ